MAKTPGKDPLMLKATDRVVCCFLPEEVKRMTVFPTLGLVLLYFRDNWEEGAREEQPVVISLFHGWYQHNIDYFALHFYISAKGARHLPQEWNEFTRAEIFTTNDPR